MSTQEKMQALLDNRSTDQLFADLMVLDSQVEGMGTPEQRMARAFIADTIESRHGLEAAMEAIFMDINYAGTYREALELAYCAVVK